MLPREIKRERRGRREKVFVTWRKVRDWVVRFVSCCAGFESERSYHDRNIEEEGFDRSVKEEDPTRGTKSHTLFAQTLLRAGPFCLLPLPIFKFFLGFQSFAFAFALPPLFATETYPCVDAIFVLLCFWEGSIGFPQLAIGAL